MVRMRSEGTLSGAFQCAPPGRSNRGLALSSINLSQTAKILHAHQTGIGMWQESCFLEHQFTHGGQVLESTIETRFFENALRLREPKLRLVAQTEQSLFAACPVPGSGRLPSTKAHLRAICRILRFRVLEPHPHGRESPFLALGAFGRGLLFQRWLQKTYMLALPMGQLARRNERLDRETEE